MKTCATTVLLLSVSAWAGAAAPPSRTPEPSALRSIKRVYIEKMDNGFDQDLQIQITRQFKGELNVVLDRDLADAVLVGSTKSSGGIGKGTLKYIGLDNASNSALTMLDKSGKTILWAEEAGDRAPWSSGNVNDSGRHAMAQRLVRKLKSAMWSR